MIAAAILIAYFLSISIAGTLLARRKNKKTTQEYFVGNNGLPLLLVIPLLFGEMIAGAGTIGNASDAFAIGISSVWAQWGMSIGCLIYMFGLIQFFYRCGQRGIMTVAEAFMVRFDKKCRNVVMIITALVYAMIFAMQPVAAAAILAPLFNINETIVIWVISAIFIIFTVTGGIKGLAHMNTLHAVVMYLGMGAVALFSLKSVGGFHMLTTKLPTTHLQLFDYPNRWTVIAWGAGAALSFLTASTLVRTTLSARSLTTAKHGTLITAVLVIPFALLPAIIGLCARVLMPDIPARSALFSLANGISPILGGIASMAIIAAIFSTAPSLLLIISTTLTKDFYCLIRPTASEQDQIKFSTISIVIVTIICTTLGTKAGSILSQLMGAFQIRSITGIVLLIAIHWKRVNSTAAFWSLLGGGITAAIWHFSGNPFGIAPMWPTTFIGILLLVVLTLLTSHQKISVEYLNSEKILSGKSQL